MTNTHFEERLISLRREFHRFPEPAWCEFRTTSRIVDELEGIGVNEIILGDGIFAGERLAVPESEEIAKWRRRAEEQGARNDVLEATEEGYTGAIGVLEVGEGPTVALRVDIDGLVITESLNENHVPASNGFRSNNEGMMHACGHDAHITIGLGVLEKVKNSNFRGTFMVIFQPAEEKAGGALPISKSEYVPRIDHLFCVHIGLNHPTGEIVTGTVKPLASSNLTARISGSSSHAGLSPNKGDNAIQAAATAIQNAYAIPRNENGITRINIGEIKGGTAANIIAEEVILEGEVRGETNGLMEYMRRNYERTLESAAEMHGCEVAIDLVGEAPRADSDEELAAVVKQAANETEGVGDVLEMTDFGASEDATHLMKRVQECGGFATYTIVGTDHPSDHHTPLFDIDEENLRIAVDTLSGAVALVSESGVVPSND